MSNVKQPGMGVMIQALSGSGAETHAAIAACIGKEIAALCIANEETLAITFVDGSCINVKDYGQSCCEHRYMRSDDDVQYYAGAALLGMEEREGPTTGDVTECAFLVVTTSKGAFTVANYNEHNGYYGGFSMQAELVVP